MLGRVWRKGNPLMLLVGMSVGEPTMEITLWRFFRKQKIQLQYDSAILLLGIYIHIYGKNYNLKRYKHPYVQSSTIHNNKDMEKT